MLAMGEPLPYETLAAVAGEEAILELDRLGLVSADQTGDVLRLRFAHPLLHAVAERRLSAPQRRVLASRLRRAPARHVDVIRRAGWEEAAADGVDIDLMLQAADAALIHDPAAAARFAERALDAGGGLRAGLLVAAARSEQGQTDLAGAALTRVAADATADHQRLQLFTAEFGLALWGRRNVRQARQVLDRARSTLPDSYRPELLAAEALAALYSAACDEAMTLARAVLAEPSSRGGPDQGADRTHRRPDLLRSWCRRRSAAAQRLLDELGRARVAAPSAGLAHALVGVTGLFFGAAFRLPPSVGRLGRWPGSPEQLEGSDEALPAATAGRADRSRLAVAGRAASPLPG